MTVERTNSNQDYRREFASNSDLCGSTVREGDYGQSKYM
ncbi:hypothetical protein IIM_04881 [Bacillus cereus VD107]|nr:hypothetical protein IIM_04881 [Bacillus cereus VD107]